MVDFEFFQSLEIIDVKFPIVGNTVPLMRALRAIALLLLAAGCSHETEELKTKVDEQDARISQLEQQVTALRDEHQKLIAGKLADVQRYTRQVGLAQQAAERTQRNLEQQMTEIRRLRDEAASTPSAAPAPGTAGDVTATPTQAYTTAVTVYQAPDPVLSDFIEPPAGTNTDSFPVLITDVQGRKVVTGSHLTTRTVPTKETYVDDFGATVNKMRTEQVEENEYDYQVVFSLRNLTRTARELSVGAGRKNKTITLQPGETATDQAVDSAYGADLAVRAAGVVRRIPVSYDE